MEVDEEEDMEDAARLTCIKHITFISKLPPFTLYKVTEPPYVMGKWAKGTEQDTLSIDCVVTYEVSMRKSL